MRRNDKGAAKSAAKVKAPSSSETPYLASRREWNERYSNHIATANNWCIAALGNIGVSLILAVDFVWVSGQHKVVPYYVETNSYGEVTRAAPTFCCQLRPCNSLRRTADLKPCGSCCSGAELLLVSVINKSFLFGAKWLPVISRAG